MHELLLACFGLNLLIAELRSSWSLLISCDLGPTSVNRLVSWQEESLDSMDCEFVVLAELEELDLTPIGKLTPTRPAIELVEPKW